MRTTRTVWMTLVSLGFCSSAFAQLPPKPPVLRAVQLVQPGPRVTSYAGPPAYQAAPPPVVMNRPQVAYYGPQTVQPPPPPPAPAPVAVRTYVEPAVPQGQGAFVFALTGGASLSTNDSNPDYSIYIASGQATLFLGKNISRPLAGGVFFDLGYQLDANMDSTGMLQRHEFAIAFGRETLMMTLGVGPNLLTGFEGGAVAGFSLSSALMARFGGGFTLSFPLCLDMIGGVPWKTVGLSLGWATL